MGLAVSVEWQRHTSCCMSQELIVVLSGIDLPGAIHIEYCCAQHYATPFQRIDPCIDSYHHRHK
jgi:hypothetical protein